ncbi:hypothetical protein ROLI_017850 [Roseobacter fucihabitans]|uniref:Uncharacterized protein n=1 Tax=Roseobacter fucihabitans TaxID=1537242 RepID=A0ABZ2BRN4_9RHOB|nr:hypothetical protein [Roseobacter litoralis]
MRTSPFDSECQNLPKRSRPTFQLQISLRMRRNGQRSKTGTSRIYRNGDVAGLMRINADNDWMYGLRDALIAKNAPAPIRADRTVMIR